jgi:hypothetical protein
MISRIDEVAADIKNSYSATARQLHKLKQTDNNLLDMMVRALVINYMARTTEIIKTGDIITSQTKLGITHNLVKEVKGTPANKPVPEQ